MQMLQTIICMIIEVMMHIEFETAMVNKNEDNSIDQVLAYDDLIKSLKYNEVNTNNHNKVLNETGYTLDLPTNYDMFLNYPDIFG